MGILDSLENSPAFRSALGQIGAAVLPVVMSEVMGTGSQGGLSAIVAKLEQAGLGNQVKSWIGMGANLPITADQLKQVLGRRSPADRRQIQHSDRPGGGGARAPAAARRGPGEPERKAAPYGVKKQSAPP